ncbi:MAG: nuclease-like protein [Alphaproteobacteria bacterium]|nr:nuclease-like protein [Alphaproteobacteria bacterium]
MRVLAILTVLVGGAVAAMAAASGAERSGYAIVQPDGTLRVDGAVLRLHGILMPDSGFFWELRLLPARFAPRAVLALDQFIRHFVRCDLRGQAEDDVITATCRQTLRPDEVVDVAAWVLEQGWVLAGPDAPPLYHVLERLARHRHVGLWGTPVTR